MSMRGKKVLQKFDQVFLSTLNKSRIAFNEISREAGITGPQMNVLLALHHHPEGVTMRELSDLQMLSHGATTGLVDCD